MLGDLGKIIVGLVAGVFVMIAASASADNPHTVVSGDTCWDIARTHLGSGELYYTAIYLPNQSNLTRDAQENRYSDSRECALIFPGIDLNIDGSDAGGSEANGAGDEFDNANGEGNEGTNGEDTGEIVDEDQPVVRCDGVIQITEDGPICRPFEDIEVFVDSMTRSLECQGLLAETTVGEMCITESPTDGELDAELFPFRSRAGMTNDEMTAVLVGLLEEEREEDDFPVWAIVLLSLLGAFFGSVVLLMLAWALFHDHYHRTSPYSYLLREIMLLRRRRTGRSRRRRNRP